MFIISKNYSRSNFKTIMHSLNKQNISIFLIWLFSISAIVGIYLGYVNWFIPKTPLNLILGAVLLFYNLPLNTLRKVMVWLVAFAVGMLVEIIGVQTGDIFGNYYYGDNLGLKLQGVPYLIGVNWAVLTFITASISHRLSKKFWVAAILGAGLMVGLDFLLEPLAGVFDFWYFENNEVPPQNFIAWFVIAFLLQVFIKKILSIQDIDFSFHLFLSQVIFFGACYLILF